MARRSKRKALNAVLVVGVGFGAWWLWRSGIVQRALSGLRGRSPELPSAVAQAATADTSGSGSILDTLLGLVQGVGSSVAGAEQSLADAFGGSVPTFALPAGLAGSYAGAELSYADLFKAAAPVWLGTSKAAGKMVHEINLAIPGDNTGLEKGNKTFFTRRGPFVVTPGSGCYGLDGRRITCPLPSEIIGIEQHTLDWYRDKIV